jgi:iron complex outermembrane receptor protein
MATLSVRLVQTAAVSAVALAGAVQAARAQSADQPVNAGEVSASGAAIAAAPASASVPTQQQQFGSGETVRILDTQQLQSIGPVAGGAQAFGLAPGAYVNGYGSTGATKYTIALDGIGQGWGGYGGYTGGASLMVTLDGVPIVDPTTGLWASASIPQAQMFSATAVTYGPGNAANRWYDNIGGNVEFTPLQPTGKAGGTASISYGSFDQKNLFFSLNSAEVAGWSSVLSAGFGEGGSYRVGPDGFDNPNNSYALYGKTVKQFDGGDVSFGGYFARSAGYRPQVIPTQPNPYITTNGISPSGTINPGPLYSQKTTGFYSTLPFNNYEKWDVNQLFTIYSKANYALTDTTELHNITYYADEERLHSRLNDVFPQGASNVQEYNNPSSYWYGDKASVTQTLPFNTLEAGAFMQASYYNTRNAFFNPLPPYFGSRYAPNAHYRDGDFNQVDSALFLQDDIHPIENLHITPGIRVAYFRTSYANNSAVDFPNATGTDQGILPPAARDFVAPEPSVEVNYKALPWLALYGSYEEAYKTPQVGGGGGLYQQIPAQYANLAHSQESQIGFKIDLDDPALYLGHFTAGANYFYLRYSKQTIDTALANGSQLTAFGNADYQGANIFFDDNPFLTAHVFGNAAIVNAVYSRYITGSLARLIHRCGAYPAI